MVLALTLSLLLLPQFAPHGGGAQGAPIASPPSDGHWRPKPGLSWQWQLADPVLDPPLDVDVYDLDWEDTPAETVASLHDRGSRVICYVNVGTWEEWRSDAATYPRSLIGNAWPEWEGERFVDIRRLDLLGPIVEARFDTCKTKGFDAIEPDLIDTYDADTGFALTENDQLRFNRWLANAAHERGLAIGQKNVPHLTTELLPDFDFAVTEDCLDEGWCDQLSPYITANKAVFAAEYTDRGMTLPRMCEAFTTLGFSAILKHRDLDAWRRACP
jgi:hypothetical protein